jgi:hypothetical protein
MFLFCYNLSFEHNFFVYKLLIRFFTIYYDFCQKKREPSRIFISFSNLGFLASFLNAEQKLDSLLNRTIFSRAKVLLIIVFPLHHQLENVSFVVAISFR